MKKILFVILLISVLLFSCRRVEKDFLEETFEKVGKELPKEISKISIKSSSKIIKNSVRPYNRIAINKEFNRVKTQLYNEAKQRGVKAKIQYAISTDAYTGKKLLGGSSFEYDHVRSAEFIFNKYKAFLTDDEIAKLVNCRENVVATTRDINRSKGKWALEKLLDDTPRTRALGINTTLSKKAATKADAAIKLKFQEIIKNK